MLLVREGPLGGEAWKTLLRLFGGFQGSGDLGPLDFLLSEELLPGNAVFSSRDA